jgi:hypothetical protein
MHGGSTTQMTESDVRELIYAAADRNVPAGASDEERWRMRDLFVHAVLEALQRDDHGWLAANGYLPSLN